MSYNDHSLFALFQTEARTQARKLTDNLITLEHEGSPAVLEELMRAAHSLKGAARIVGHESVAAIAHELEECFVTAQEGRISISGDQINVLLRAVDALATAAHQESDALEAGSDESAREQILNALRAIAHDAVAVVPATHASGAKSSAPRLPNAEAKKSGWENTDRLLTLASEALVATRALASHVEDGRDRWADQEVERAFDGVRSAFVKQCPGETPQVLGALHEAVTRALNRKRDRAFLLDTESQRVSSAIAQLYEGILDARMLPFGDGVIGLPRLVRDTARELGREVDLVTLGETTPVDREVLRRLDAPLGHLIRNAVDHGIESPADRVAQGKPSRGTIRVEARHGGGRLLVSVEDDGRGLDFAAVRLRVVARGLADAQAVAAMSDAELSHFLFLPGFTMRDEVTSISGRGVGLDAVQMSVREIGGMCAWCIAHRVAPASTCSFRSRCPSSAHSW